MTPQHTLPALPASGRDLQTVLTSRWARLFLPSLADLFFLALLIWLFMTYGGAGWQGLLADADTGWHIRTGEYILDHHSVPRQDLYSFSKPGAPWYAWEWGSDVIFALLHRLAGLKGVVLTAGIIIGLFATTVLLRMILRGAHVFISLAAALLSVGSASIHFLARPHVFTLLLLSVSVWIIECDREKPSRRLWWLVPLTVVWTNLHGGFMALIAIAGLTAVGCAFELNWQDAKRYLGLAAACSAASLINPYGYKLHVHVVEYLRSDWIKKVVQEFQSPSFRTENMMQFEVLLLAGVMTAGALLARRRVAEALWILFFAHEALASTRHVPVFVTVCGPLIAMQLTVWWRALSEHASKNSIRHIVNSMAADAAAAFRRTSVWPAAVLLALILIGKPIPWPEDFPDLVFPANMVHRHETDILGVRTLTTDQWADYLIYLNPRQKVFVDGRSDFYGPEIGDQYLRFTNAQWDWRDTLEKNHFQTILLPVELPIIQLLKLQPDWRVVEDDGKRILLVHTDTSVPSTGFTRPEPRF